MDKPTALKALMKSFSEQTFEYFYQIVFPDIGTDSIHFKQTFQAWCKNRNYPFDELRFNEKYVKSERKKPIQKSMLKLKIDEARTRWGNEKGKLAEMMDKVGSLPDDQFSKVFNALYGTVYPDQISIEGSAPDQPGDYDLNMNYDQFTQKWESDNPGKKILSQEGQKAYYEFIKTKKGYGSEVS